MTDAPAAPAIFDALVRIGEELGKIEKDGRGPTSQGGYPFMKVDTIVARLNPLMSQHGVVCVPNQVDAEQVTFRFPKVTPDGTPVHDGRPDAFQIISRLRYEFTFVSSEDGSSLTAAAYGESADTGDKGIRRAATAAYKEVLLRLFNITSGEEDPDSLDPNDQPAAIRHQDRGAQAREKAAARKPRAPRGGGSSTPDAPVEQQPAVGTNNQDPDTDQQGDEERAAAAPVDEAQPVEQQFDDPTPPAAPAAPATASPTPAERRAAASAARKTRASAQPAEPAAAADAPAEFQVDPADVAHAEATQPAPRVAETPVAKPEPETKADEQYESLADVRKAIRTALQARGLDRDYANELGDQVTGKDRGAWFANKGDLVKVLRAIEAGEVADEADPDTGGF